MVVSICIYRYIDINFFNLHIYMFIFTYIDIFCLLWPLFFKPMHWSLFEDCLILWT